METCIGCGMQSLTRTRLQLSKSMAGLPPNAPRPQDSIEKDTSYYHERNNSESWDSQVE